MLAAGSSGLVPLAHRDGEAERLGPRGQTMPDRPG